MKCQEKVRYANKKTAKKFKHAAEKKKCWKLTIYKCEKCEWFHYTSHPLSPHQIKMKEKLIEKAIIDHLYHMGAIVEWNNWGSVIIKKWPHIHKMNLQRKWCPDITWCYNWRYFWIEVKKDEKTVEKWIKNEKRYDLGEILPECLIKVKELDQILYKKKILKNWWKFLLTCDFNEAIEFITELR